MQPQLNHNKLGEIDTITVKAAGYRAVVLLQGAQLIHFLTDSDDSNLAESDHSSSRSDSKDHHMNNWLWVSEQAAYKKGDSVRGGVPICWPVFGSFDANPQAVKDSFANCPFDIKQHGYARIQDFVLDSFNPSVNNSSLGQSDDVSQLVLVLPPSGTNEPNLELKAVFHFSKDGFSITLITQNNSGNTVHFSQALHTYLPTDDISDTAISGFDGINYSDTLTTDWETKMQQGDIRFVGEVDRIYHGAPDITLNTPKRSYQLAATGSNSTVVWNPWQDKARAISQFAADDYQRMLCIETANAHLDAIRLESGDAHELSLTLTKQDLNAYLNT